MHEKPLVLFRLSIYLFSAAGFALFCLPGKANLKERYNKAAQASSENAQFFSKEWKDLGDFGTGWQKSFYVDGSGNIYSFSSPGARANFVGVLGKEYRRNDNACGMQRMFGAFSDNFVPQFDCASKVYTTTTVYEIDRVKGVAGCGLYKYTTGRWNYELSPLSSGNGSQSSVKRVELGVCNSIYSSRVEEVEGDFNRAYDCYEKDDYNCAVTNIKKHLNRYPSDIKSLRMLARNYYLKGDYLLAISRFDQILDMDKTSADDWYFRAQSKFWKRDYNGAMQDHRKYLYGGDLVRTGDFAQSSWFFLGNSHAALGNCYSAIDGFTEAISTPGRVNSKGVVARSYLHRGIVKYKMGNVEAAKEDFDAAIALEPSLNSGNSASQNEVILPHLNIKVKCLGISPSSQEN